MGFVRERIVLNAKPENVWKFVTNPENFPAYVHGYTHGKTVSKNVIGSGARYEWYGKFGPFKVKSIEDIVEWQERKYVAYRGKMFGVPFNSSMAVKDVKPGKTRLTVTIEYSVPFYLGWKLVDFLFVRKIVRDSLRKSLQRLDMLI